MEDTKDDSLGLSPISRLGMTFDIEMSLDTEKKLFNDEKYKNTLKMYQTAIDRRNNVLRSVFLADFLLLILVNGNNFTLPMIGINLNEFPGALQLVSIYASFSFMMFAILFFNEQSYLSIVSQYNIRDGRKLGVDPDFISCSDYQFEFFVKLFRYRMNIWGPDFYIPEKPYTVFFFSLMVAVFVSIIGMVVLHVLMISTTIYNLATKTSFITSVPIAVIVIGMNIIGFLVIVTMTKEFSFKIAAPTTASTAPPPGSLANEPVQAPSA